MTKPKKRSGPTPPPDRIRDMGKQGYALVSEITERFEVSKMTLYNWERDGKLEDPTAKKRAASIKVAGNRWFLIDAVAARFKVPEAGK